MDTLHVLLIGTIVGMLIVLWLSNGPRWMVGGIPIQTERSGGGCAGSLIGLLIMVSVIIFIIERGFT